MESKESGTEHQSDQNVLEFQPQNISAPVSYSEVAKDGEENLLDW